MKQLVTFECVEDSHDWGKKGMTNKVVFPMTAGEKEFKSVAPSNWKVSKIELTDKYGS